MWETAASRDEAVVVPGAQVRSAAARTWAQTPAADERDEADQGQRGRRGLVIGLAAVVVLAAVAFGVWWFALREAPNGPAPDVTAAMVTILQPVADAQDDTDGSLTRLDAADKGSFAAARAAAAALVSEVTAARTAASGLVIEGHAAAVDQLRARWPRTSPTRARQQICRRPGRPRSRPPRRRTRSPRPPPAPTSSSTRRCRGSRR